MASTPPRRRSARPARPRRTAAVVAAVTLSAVALSVAGCGGGGPLTPDQAVGALVAADQVPGEGWVAGETGTVAPEGGDGGLSDLLESASDLSAACRSALDSFGADAGSPASFATRTFAQASTGPLGSRDLTVAIRSYDGDPPGLPDAAAAARDCPTFELRDSGEQLRGTLRPVDYGVDGSAGLGIDLVSGDAHVSLDLVRATRGHDLVTLSVTGADAAANRAVLVPVVTTQVDRVSGARR